jgi:flagellar biosynthesis chaperone FliJ
MTYDQVAKMDKDDLVYAFKRMIEIAEELEQRIKDIEKKFDERDEDFGPYGHIGMLEARLIITKGQLQSVIEVVTGK